MARSMEIRVGLQANCPDDCEEDHFVAVVMEFNTQWSNAGIVEHGKDPKDAFDQAYATFKKRFPSPIDPTDDRIP